MIIYVSQLVGRVRLHNGSLPLALVVAYKRNDGKVILEMSRSGEGGEIVLVDDLLAGLGFLKDFVVHQVAVLTLKEKLEYVGHYAA